MRKLVRNHILENVEMVPFLLEIVNAEEGNTRQHRQTQSLLKLHRSDKRRLHPVGESILGSESAA